MKGKTNNPNGRPKGVPKQQWQRVELQDLSDEQLATIVEEITAAYDENDNT